MPDKVLIVYSGHELARGLEATFAARRFEVISTSCLVEASRHLRDGPLLTLLDVELAADENNELERFSEDCQLADIPCLRYSSNGREEEEIERLAPWAAGTIFSPGSGRDVLQHVDTQLQIKDLLNALTLAEGRLSEKQYELDEGLRSAAAIQKSLLPTHFPASDTFRFAWRFLPCGRVGGDLLNILKVSEDVIMAYLLDVSGHGVSSAMVTVSVFQSLSLHTGRIVKQYLDHPPFYRIPGPAEVLSALDEEYPIERFDKFFTISYLLLNTRTGEVRFSNGGHPPPILIRTDGTSELLEEGGSLIGMGGVLPFDEGVAHLQKGDRLFLYSDGIFECADPEGTHYGEERMFQTFGKGGALGLDQVCEEVMESLCRFSRTRTFEDDITLLGIEYLGSAVNAEEIND